MKVLVVYDSVHGNTEQIARSIASGASGGAAAVRVNAASDQELEGVDLLVIGSPTHGGRPTEAIQSFVSAIPRDVARKLSVAAFDTRLATKLVKVFGYAAGRMAETLQQNGSTLRCPPEGFVVKGRGGPLAEGETQRAEAWARATLKA